MFLKEYFIKFFYCLFLTLYYLQSLLKGLRKDSYNAGFPSLKVTRMRILRTLLGTILGDGESLKALKKTAVDLARMQVLEEGMIAFAFKYPGLFLTYLFHFLYPKAKKDFNPLKSKMKKLVLVHNFAGAKLGVMLSMIQTAVGGENSVVLVDESALYISKQLVRKFLNNRQDETEWTDDKMVIEMKHFYPYTGADKFWNSRVVLINTKKESSMLQVVRLVKKSNYNLILIPETNFNNNQSKRLDFLGGKLMFPKGIFKLFRYTETAVSIITNMNDDIFYPQFMTSIDTIQDRETSETILSRLVKGYERFVFVNPQLFVPFDLTHLWDRLYDCEKEDNHNIVTDTVFGKQKCLLLMSNGKLYICHREELKAYL